MTASSTLFRCSRLNTITSEARHSQLYTLRNKLLQLTRLMLETMRLEHLEVGKKRTALLTSTIK